MKISSATLEMFHIRVSRKLTLRAHRQSRGTKDINIYLEYPLFLSDFNQKFCAQKKKIW